MGTLCSQRCVLRGADEYTAMMTGCIRDDTSEIKVVLKLTEIHALRKELPHVHVPGSKTRC